MGNEQQNEDVINFLNACNEFIEGKFILADIKISKILRAISKSSSLYDLIAEGLINYDFKKEFEKLKEESISSGNNHLDLPLDNQDIIPFVFSLLVEIDSKRINFDELLATSFPLCTSQKEEYEAFAQYIIVPYRNAVAQIYNLDVKEYVFEEHKDEKEENIIDKKLKELEKLDKEIVSPVSNPLSNIDERLDEVNQENILAEPEEEEEQDVQKFELNKEEETSLLFDRIARMCSVMQGKLQHIKDTLKRSNINLLLDALTESCKLKNKKIAVALIMSLNLATNKQRFLRSELKEINNICYEFYA